MSNQAEEVDEVVDQQVEQEEASEVEQEEVAQAESEQTGDDESSESEQVVVSIGDVSPASEDEAAEGSREWLNALRKSNRDKAIEVAALREEIARRDAASPAAQPVTLGPKPTLEGADYDAEKFEEQLTAWHERKRMVGEQERKKEEAVAADRQAWNERREAYSTQKSALKVPDYDEAEAYALESLSVTQQAVILQGAENSALVVYALGKNPGKAKELAAIKDPVKFAFAVAKLETQMKVSTRRIAPLPETKVSGSGRTAVAGDQKLAALEAKADKTGDRTELVNYKRAQKLRQAA